MSVKRSVRFVPDPGTVAKIYFSQNESVPLMALVINESHGGAALVVIHNQDIPTGTKIKVQVGELPVLSAEVRWTKVVEAPIKKIGVMYLE